MTRQSHQLSDLESKQFYNLRPFPGDAWSFWRRAASVRGLDPETLITKGEVFSGLPVGHGKHWCFPIPLECKGRP